MLRRNRPVVVLLMVASLVAMSVTTVQARLQDFELADLTVRALDCTGADPDDTSTCAPLPGIGFQVDYDGVAGESTNFSLTDESGEFFLSPIAVPAQETVTYLEFAPEGTVPIEPVVVVDLEPGDSVTIEFVFVPESDGGDGGDDGDDGDEAIELPDTGVGTSTTPNGSANSWAMLGGGLILLAVASVRRRRLIG